MKPSPMPEAFELESLLAPISEETPSGESLRYEGTYDRIQVGRREDDPELPQGVWQTKLRKADWESVRDVSVEVLLSRTKDLQIAVWLLEAWLHLHGFTGVLMGLRLVTQFCERFWDDLHPQIEDGDLEYRIAPIEWLNEKVSLKLKRIFITQPQKGRVPPYTWGDRERAFQTERFSVQRPAAEHYDDPSAAHEPVEARVNLADLHESIILTPASFYHDLGAHLNETIAALQYLEELLESRCGPEAPRLHQFREEITKMQHFVQGVLPEQADGDVADDRVADDRAEPGLQEEDQPEDSGSGGRTISADQLVIRGRTDAYRLLAQIAEYLHQIEPHSPTPYLIRRAVSWGHMTLVELLRELVHDYQNLESIHDLLGIRDAPNQEEEAR